MMKKALFLLISTGLLLTQGCTNKHLSSILVERGVEPYEREYLVTQEGYGIDARLKKIFVQGYIEEGMTQEMVNMLWGPPDREFDDGQTWEFVNREGYLISRVKFKRSDVPRLGIYEQLVENVDGDRYGGSLPPGKAKPE